ncbi:MAG: transposase, partial [Prevotella sp.]|nr:transposase [Prevotella sp.]
HCTVQLQIRHLCQSMGRQEQPGFGKLFADKGYISQGLFDRLFNDGVQLVTGLRCNMKNKPMPLYDKILQRKRSVMETINDELKNVAQLLHSRHRSVFNFAMNASTAIATYSFFDKKPSINIDFCIEDNIRGAYPELRLLTNKVKPKFYVINFDDPRRSHRCNPIHPDFMSDISDAYESAYTIMLNLNKTWVQKQGDFFVEPPIVLFAAIIWYLRIFEGGKYCTFPHAIEFLCRKYEDIIPILTSYPELENYLSPFMDAWQGGAADQLMGQIASAKIPLSRMISPQLYWIMTGDDFTLDINNPQEPKILCVGNNPDRQNIYGAALGLYNSRIVKLINKKGMLKSSVLIDELPTIYFKGLDNLIATARSNKVAVCLGFFRYRSTTRQDISQLKRDYGDKEAAVVMNTVGNIFSGQVVGETAKTLSERFGKVLQKRQSMSITRSDKTTTISTQMDSLIPQSKISTLTQGMFVGAVADNFSERIKQKIFHCEIVVDNAKVAKETAAYRPIPILTDFTNENGEDMMDEEIKANYDRVKTEVRDIVERELQRISDDPELSKLLNTKK